MGRMPSPLQNVAVVYPFLQEAPLGRVTEFPSDEGYKRSMPCGRTECKRKAGPGKAPMPGVTSTSERQCIEASHSLPVRDHRTGDENIEGTKEVCRHFSFPIPVMQPFAGELFLGQGLEL